MTYTTIFLWDTSRYLVHISKYKTHPSHCDIVNEIPWLNIRILVNIKFAYRLNAGIQCIKDIFRIFIIIIIIMNIGNFFYVSHSRFNLYISVNQQYRSENFNLIFTSLSNNWSSKIASCKTLLYDGIKSAIPPKQLELFFLVIIK